MSDDVLDTSFVPLLDARQRAMLAEMGVRVWAPKPVPPAVAAPLVEAPQTAAQTPRVAAPPVVAPSRPVPTPPPTPSSAPPAPAEPPPSRPSHVDRMDWPELRETVANCQACGLCKGRKNTVFGVGDVQTDWMIVGEAPGENEDLQGEPFVGAAGQLLDNMLRAVGRSRQGEGAQGAYIANVLKCRPPANRNPQPEEVARCEPYLVRQVTLVKPKVIVAMGRFAVQSLLKTTEPIGRLRGRVHRYEGVPVIVTYHPAYLLRTPGDKGKAWADLCLAMHTLDNA
ncbi:MAG: uracil-DNA glycosylase [Hydrogenophaga sp.]|uniref:uracil-DNA glycosylase n=1 Tax=Hydrogenophaga sp. TaxID=1904254 RepID=UPI0025C2133F|nr:uracil-DNA glycosylase [Hydrogenophaga sp.]MBU7572212.1 uracil-DNA glycosylase [Hydrogenophaga sp.]